jgi:hypothetical protein
MNNLSNKNIPYQQNKIITNVKAINDITRIVNNLKNITFDPLTFDIINLPTGLYVKGKAGGTATPTDDLATFRCLLDEPAVGQVTVKSGMIRRHGLSHIEIPDTILDLEQQSMTEGSQVYIFAYFTWNDASYGISCSQSMPYSDAMTGRVPLVQVNYNIGKSITLIRTLHKYDVQFANPMV